jgi:hypothetical protein
VGRPFIGGLGGLLSGAVADGTADACDDAPHAGNVDQGGVDPGGDGNVSTPGDGGDGSVDSVDQGNVDPGGTDTGNGDDGTCTCSYVPMILAAGAWAIRGSRAKDPRLELLAFSSSLIGATLGTAGYLNRSRIARAMARLAS